MVIAAAEAADGSDWAETAAVCTTCRFVFMRRSESERTELE